MEFPAIRRRLPDQLTRRVQRYINGEVEVATPRDAATVALLRDRPGSGLEVYLLRRATSMSFAGGMYAFPGGGVDPRDADRTVEWIGPLAEAWARPFGADVPLARALVCAAVRETFEESGVLLAGPGEETVVADTRGDTWEADRRALVDRSLSFADVLERRGLLLRSDLLRAWAHWITPEFEPRRYDTRFFVAALPDGQRSLDVAADVGGEADRAVWVRPPDALAAYERGEMAMMPPTVATVTELADFDSVDAVLAHSRDPEPWLPTVTVADGRAYLVLPGDAGNPR